MSDTIQKLTDIIVEQAKQIHDLQQQLHDLKKQMELEQWKNPPPTTPPSIRENVSWTPSWEVTCQHK